MLVAQLSTDDLDAAVRATRDVFPGFLAAPGDEPPHFEISAYRVDGLTYFDYAFSGLNAHFEVPSAAGFAAAEMDLNGRMTVGRDTVDVSRPFAVPKTSTADVVSVHSQVTQFDESQLLAFVRRDLGRDGFELRMLGFSAVSAQAATHWRSAASLFRERLRDGLADEPLIGASLRQLLFAAYLYAFPSTWSEAGDPSDGSRAVPASLRRAMTYMEEHAHEPITTADMAGAARMSSRGLQAAFRRTLDVSPTDYLRRVRLDRVRRELLTADPSAGSTVADIARRWGFAHLGRFAHYYRASFGENPNQTLRA